MRDVLRRPGELSSVWPARMLTGTAIAIFAGGGTCLLFITLTNAGFEIERFKRSLKVFSSLMVEDTLPL
jgi:hypothetical protein